MSCKQKKLEETIQQGPEILINIQLIPIPCLSSKREIHSLVSILCVNHTGMLAIECYAC